jgi:hypothetical protein
MRFREPAPPPTGALTWLSSPSGNPEARLGSLLLKAGSLI